MFRPETEILVGSSKAGASTRVEWESKLFSRFVNVSKMVQDNLKLLLMTNRELVPRVGSGAL